MLGSRKKLNNFFKQKNRKKNKNQKFSTKFQESTSKTRNILKNIHQLRPKTTNQKHQRKKAKKKRFFD